MERKPKRSAYAKAMLFLLLAVAAMPLALWADLPLLWLAGGAIASFLHRCPRCAKLLFMRGWLGVPWPPRTCIRCGRDLTVP